MPWSPDSSITGGTITSFTTPAYTLALDMAPQANAKQHTVIALTGTQGAATANSSDKPFTVTLVKPQLSGLPAANPVTGQRGPIPRNKWQWIFRKGGDVASGLPQTAVARLSIEVPAGMESYNPDQVKALVSFIVGILSEESNDIADTLLTGVVS